MSPINRHRTRRETLRTFVRALDIGASYMQVLSKALSCLAVLCAAILFAGLYDVGHFGLKKLIGPFAIVPISLLLVGSLMPLFLRGNAKPVESAGTEEFTDKIEDVRTELGSRISNLQGTVDGLSGQNTDSLIEENSQLKEQLDAIQQAERDRVLRETQELRSRNEALEEQIKQWAIKTVDETISPDDAEVRSAA